jgi:hypothetical protein
VLRAAELSDIASMRGSDAASSNENKFCFGLKQRTKGPTAARLETATLSEARK